jgi:hypothetical protein
MPCFVLPCPVLFDFNPLIHVVVYSAVPDRLQLYFHFMYFPLSHLPSLLASPSCSSQDKLDIRQAVDGGHVVSGLTEVVVKDKEQVSVLRIESAVMCVNEWA